MDLDFSKVLGRAAQDILVAGAELQRDRAAAHGSVTG